MNDVTTAPEPRTLTVSELNRAAREVLEGGFPFLVRVEGEISNLARPASGHLYFTLKDAAAQVRCALFRNRAANLRFRPKNGDHVLLRGRVGFYEPRGEFQLVAEHMEEAGAGALQQAFEALKKRLEVEGLFATERKRPLPPLPRRIGVITSPSGAAIRDVLTVLQRRFPAIRVLIYPVPVQGANAAEQIATAIRLASERKEVDALLVTRGGGSLEDLWAFNEEIVARALFDCEIPVVSAVGHEIDFTIADFASDRRAPTPSAAAEMLSPDGMEWLSRMIALDQRMAAVLRRRLRAVNEHLAGIGQRLARQHPGRRMQERGQRIDEMESRLAGALRSRVRENRTRLTGLTSRLDRRDPRTLIETLKEHGGSLEQRLRAAIIRATGNRSREFAALARALEAVSPLATLGRGYSIVRDKPGGRIIRDAASVKQNSQIYAQLAKGGLYCTVDRVDTDSQPEAE